VNPHAGPCSGLCHRFLAWRVAVAALLALLLLSVPSHAMTTGSGNARSETRIATDFQALSLRGGINLVVRQSTSAGFSVRADDTILRLVQTFVEGSRDARTLCVQFKPGESLRPKTPVLVTVDVVKLRALAGSGAGDIGIEPLKTPALILSISGSSDAKLRQLDTEPLTRSIAGSGDVRARDLAAAEVRVLIAGSGNASVTAHRTISVTIAGSGNVEYGGGATLVQRIAGSGSVRQRQP